MLQDGGLDLGGVDILAAADDHVLKTADDGIETVAIPPRHIPGVKPTVADGRGAGLRVLPIPRTDMGAADQKLPHGVRGQLLVGLVDDAHLAVKDGLAHRAALGDGFRVRHAETIGADLREPVALAKDHTLLLPPSIHDRLGTGRPAADEPAHAAEVRRREPRRLHPHLEDGRHPEDDGAAFFLDDPQ